MMGNMESTQEKPTHLGHQQTPSVAPSAPPNKLKPNLRGKTDGEINTKQHGEPSKNHDRHLNKGQDRDLNKRNDSQANPESARSFERDDRFLLRQLKQVSADYNACVAENRQLWKAYQSERSMRKDAESEVKRMGTDNSSLEGELNHVRGRLESLTGDLKKTQLNSFKQAQTGWLIEEDSEICLTLTGLYKDVRRWAKKYGTKSLDAFRNFNVEHHGQLLTALSKVAFFKSWDDLLTFKHPFLILAALVSDLLTDVLFSHYFYIFQSPADPHDNGMHAGVLEETFDRLSNTNAADAHMWRALLLRAVFANPESPGMGIRDELGVGHPDKFRKLFMNAFGYCPISVFIPPLDSEEWKEAATELEGLFSCATRLFARIQTQRAGYTWHNSSAYLHTAFDVHSPALEADRLVKLEDEDDISCNGKEVSIVVSPAVSRYGDSNGENYDIGRFLAKAVVFLDG